MTTTTLVLDWDSDFSTIKDWKNGREYDNHSPEGPWANYIGFRLEFDQLYGCDVINVRGRLTSIPEKLIDVPLKYIVLSRQNAPVTKAHDGVYVDGNFTQSPDGIIRAWVESYFVGDNPHPQQSIRVEGNGGVTLQELNNWFDYLQAGKKDNQRQTALSYGLETRRTLGV